MPSNTHCPTSSAGRLVPRADTIHPSILTPGAAEPEAIYLEAHIAQDFAESKGSNAGHSGLESLPTSHSRVPQQSSTLDATRTNDVEATAEVKFVQTKFTSSDTQEVIAASGIELPKNTPGQRPFSWEPIPRPTKAHQGHQNQGEVCISTPNPLEDKENASQTNRFVKNGATHQSAVEEAMAQGPDLRPERVRLFEDLQMLICSLCFSNAFIDKIPNRPAWYSLNNGLRLARSIMSSEQKRFYARVEEDMYRFYDLVKNDPLVQDKALEGENVALRWNLVKFIWRIIREQILEHEGNALAKELDQKTAEHIHKAVRPFTQEESDQKDHFRWILYATRQATRLKSLLVSNDWTWYEFKLPPNFDGTCIGDGSKEHVQYVNLDGKGHDGPQKIYGVILGPLVRHTWTRGETIGISVESPAWVADYSPEE